MLLNAHNHKLNGHSKLPDSLVRGAQETANRISDSVEDASSRVIKTASKVGDRTGELSGQIGDRVGHAQSDAKASGHRRLQVIALRTALARRRMSSDALLKAQLAKTSRELAHESSDLSEAIKSLNGVIKANRRAGAKRRTRLIGGLALGAALMYHLDPERGHERRSATAQRLLNHTPGLHG